MKNAISTSPKTKPGISAGAYLEELIIKDDHPCVMAQSVMRSGNYKVLNMANLSEPSAIVEIYKTLGQFISQYDVKGNNFSSFMLTFDAPLPKSELQFESELWQLLSALHDLDDKPWDPEVSADPESPHFSFSLHGRAFYLVGMHPMASRDARRTKKPMIVFNLHSQFEKLRDMNIYQRTRDRIRQRDVEQNGSINPMLKDFGESSEAMQYSGRKVDGEWKCPFH